MANEGLENKISNEPGLNYFFAFGFPTNGSVVVDDRGEEVVFQTVRIGELAMLIKLGPKNIHLKTKAVDVLIWTGGL